MARRNIQEVVDLALREDSAWSDVTTGTVIDPSWNTRAYVTGKEPGVLAGIEVMMQTFLTVDAGVEVDTLMVDGSLLKRGDTIARVQGRAGSILSAERVALNFLQHLSGIATETSRYVEAVRGLPVRIVDTRKTVPGMRWLQKYAVRMGGGYNHRRDLSDGVLIKDNHLAMTRAQGMTLSEVVTMARRHAPFTLKLELEVATPEEAIEAAEAGADIIMLDNMAVDDMRHAVAALKGRVLLEASGGITLKTVRQVAETGVDFISIGALTHSVRSLDISLEF